MYHLCSKVQIVKRNCESVGLCRNVTTFIRRQARGQAFVGFIAQHINQELRHEPVAGCSVGDIQVFFVVANDGRTVLDLLPCKKFKGLFATGHDVVVIIEDYLVEGNFRSGVRELKTGSPVPTILSQADTGTSTSTSSAALKFWIAFILILLPHKAS